MRRKQLWVLPVGILAVVLGLLSGCGKRETVLQRDQAQYPVAIQIYEEGCITCHGSNLQGGIGPKLQHIGSKLTEAQIEHRVDVGSGPMPAYRAPGDDILTAAQVKAVSQWLETKK